MRQNRPGRKWVNGPRGGGSSDLKDSTGRTFLRDFLLLQLQLSPLPRLTTIRRPFLLCGHCQPPRPLPPIREGLKLPVDLVETLTLQISPASAVR